MNILQVLTDQWGLSGDNGDFWELKRGNRSMWIITHAACEKIAAMPDEKGRIIRVTEKPEIVKAGESGLNGKEVVVHLTVALVDQNGAPIETCYSFGEANESNCKIPYAWSMAYKRAFDRGVMKLRGLSALGAYSTEEFEGSDVASIAKQTKSTVVTPPKPAAKEAVAVMPPKPVKASVQGEVKPFTEERRQAVEKASKAGPPEGHGSVWDALVNASEPLSKTEMIQVVGLDRATVTACLQHLTDTGMAESIGKTRGKRWLVAGRQLAEGQTPEAKLEEIESEKPSNGDGSGPVTAEEFEEFYNTAHNQGMNVLDIQKCLRAAGVDNPAQQIAEGTLTQGHLSQFWSAAEHAAVGGE